MGDAHSITAALGGRWFGRYGLARCPAHGDRKPSLSLSNAADGRLLAHCHTGCAFTDILDALKGLGVVEGNGNAPSIDPAILAEREAGEIADAKKREAQALESWNAARPISGTIAETYLRERGITCRLPDSLRFHPDCWHPTAQRLPATVARIDGAERFATHRTYLRTDGSGKADAEPSKAMLGRTAGGAVRLTEGLGPIVVAEGIETALSLASGLLRGPATIWAALSASGMKALRLPDKPGRLTIASDGDPAGRDAANALGERAASFGWDVSLLPAPDGKDWNDVLASKGACT